MDPVVSLICSEMSSKTFGLHPKTHHCRSYRWTYRRWSDWRDWTSILQRTPKHHGKANFGEGGNTLCNYNKMWKLKKGFYNLLDTCMVTNIELYKLHMGTMDMIHNQHILLTLLSTLRKERRTKKKKDLETFCFAWETFIPSYWTLPSPTHP